MVDIVALEGPFLHDLSGSLGFEPYLNFSTRMREWLETNGKNILKSFKDQCLKEGIECEDILTSGVVSSEICEQAKLADLVIVGRRGVNAQFEYGLLGSVAEGVIRKSPKPVVVVPERFTPPENPLLAYDGSVNASKVMHSCAELLKALDLPLTVIVAKEEDGESLLKEAEDYLRPYGIKTRFVHLKEEPPVAIERYCIEGNHDLIFMGATSRTRLLAMVLGSTTEYILRSVDIPVFVER